MNKKELALLEMAFAAEIDGALSKNPVMQIMQTESKLAAKLVTDGMLVNKSMRTGGNPWPCTVDGYVLTELGRLTYCMSC